LGFADYKYVVLDDPLTPDHVTRRMRIATFSIKMAYWHCFHRHYSATNQARSI